MQQATNDSLSRGYCAVPLKAATVFELLKRSLCILKNLDDFVDISLGYDTAFERDHGA